MVHLNSYSYLKAGITMQVIPYEPKYAQQIATLLNEFLPFQPETTDTVDQAGGIRFICIDAQQKVVGYIAGYMIEDARQEFPYFQATLTPLTILLEQKSSLYTSHFVVHPLCRKQGIGTKLVTAYMEAAEQVAEAIVVVGWVKSDTNRWDAERLFTNAGCTPTVYIPRYFEPYQVDCPSCQGLCYCDAHILMKTI